MISDTMLRLLLDSSSKDYEKQLVYYKDFFSNNDVYIANCGVMNHGKSSLFNSLANIGDDEGFKVADKRETTIFKTMKWRDGIYLIDTPGLEANETDDIEAWSGYKKASAIIYVHTLKTGEIHREGLEEMKMIADSLGSDSYFWKHFCLVFTSPEGMSNDEIEKIKNKSLSDIEKICGIKDFPVFIVSNTRYKKEKLKEKSGIYELRKYVLETLVTDCRNDANKRKELELNNLKKIRVHQLEKKRNNLKVDIEKNNKKIRKVKEEIADIEADFDAEIYAKEDEIEQLSKKVDNEQRRLNQLKNQHKKEKEMYN